jgi:regulator of sigma E protease
LTPTKRAADPTTDTPPELTGSWLGQNAPVLAILAALVAFLFYKFALPDILAIVYVVLGLGLVIFIHELGHFLVAKWCDVHVKTFSIGFGPALPGCSFQRGETTYMIALLPLGGYVHMVGEGFDSDEGEADPRSLTNKPVWQRMLIISAGVTMNLILAFASFVVAFRYYGDEQFPGVIQTMETGSPLWKSGARSGEVIEWIDGRGPYPSIDQDLMPVVMHSREGEPIRFVFGPAGKDEWVETEIVPRKDKEDPKPMIGIGFPAKAELLPEPYRKQIDRPVVARSAADLAGQKGPGFDFGDVIIGTTDPDNPDQIKELPPDPRVAALPDCLEYEKRLQREAAAQGRSFTSKRDYFELEKRLRRLAGRPLVIRVRRHGSGEEVDIHLPPSVHYVLGLRMRMGKISALRNHSAAEARGLRPDDIIEQVEVVDSDGQKKHLPLDPLRLPLELRQWAATKTGSREVTLRVLRNNAPADGAAPPSHKELRTEVVTVPWDASWEFNLEDPLGQSSPMTIPELGLAYRVETTIDAVTEGSPATHARVTKKTTLKVQKGDVIRDAAGKLVEAKEDEEVTLDEGFQVNLRPGDVIKACRSFERDKESEQAQPRPWVDLKSDQWARVFFLFQRANVKQLGLRLDRAQLEVTVDAEPDPSWPLADVGILLAPDIILKKADDYPQALAMGLHKTYGFIEQILGNLSSVGRGRVSPQLFVGPVGIAQYAFAKASENIYAFIAFLGMIGVNLAVLNFLPIPVLDGGHMVFLTYEWLRGKPPSARVRLVLTILGIAFILFLMVAVTYSDVKRFFW